MTIKSRFYSVPPAYNIHVIYYLVFYYIVLIAVGIIYQEMKKHTNSNGWTTILLIVFTILIGFTIIISFSSTILNDLNDIDNKIVIRCLTIISLVLLALNVGSVVYLINKPQNNKPQNYNLMLIILYSLLVSFFMVLLLIGFILQKIKTGFTLLFFISMFYILYILVLYLIFALKKYSTFNLNPMNVVTLLEISDKQTTQINNLLTTIPYFVGFFNIVSIIFIMLRPQYEYEDFSYVIINSYNFIIFWYIFLIILFIIVDIIILITGNMQVLWWVSGILSFFYLLKLCFIVKDMIFNDNDNELNYKYKYANIEID